jgi:hypothetical protein
MVAPHTPTLPYGSLAFSLQGPMAQCLQHAESLPMGHAFMLAALSNAVSTPSFLAFSSICLVASQIVTSLMSISFFLDKTFCFSILPPSWKYLLLQFDNQIIDDNDY